MARRCRKEAAHSKKFPDQNYVRRHPHSISQNRPRNSLIKTMWEDIHIPSVKTGQEIPWSKLCEKTSTFHQSKPAKKFPDQNYVRRHPHSISQNRPRNSLIKTMWEDIHIPSVKDGQEIPWSKLWEDIHIQLFKNFFTMHLSLGSSGRLSWECPTWSAGCRWSYSCFAVACCWRWSDWGWACRHSRHTCSKLHRGP